MTADKITWGRLYDGSYQAELNAKRSKQRGKKQKPNKAGGSLAE